MRNVANKNDLATAGNDEAMFYDAEAAKNYIKVENVMAQAENKNIHKVVTFGAVKTNEDVELAAYGMLEKLFPELKLSEDGLKLKAERLRKAKEEDLKEKAERQQKAGQV